MRAKKLLFFLRAVRTARVFIPYRGANASLDGTGYYLCLHRMRDTDWVLLLAIPAQYVATNTQILVDSVVRTLVFAGFGLAVIFLFIFMITMRMQQQEQLYRKEQEISAKLELSRGQISVKTQKSLRMITILMRYSLTGT